MTILLDLDVDLDAEGSGSWASLARQRIGWPVRACFLAVYFERPAMRLVRRDTLRLAVFLCVTPC